ncbi:huntingtin-interacting protein 1-related protein-like isoform X2 [Syngnathus acus]|uniref:huntingtin-interacting protein 1-related protein-like isoform X2 n=1 Tax=Syngnathus acus TaxID=161584 RepID=UPI001885C664|nr:huntingtin-interacting protein 1-related protein-like isoform X2 [Syngnathus acus]
MSKTKNKSENKTEKALAAEKEQFGKQQLQYISKCLTPAEAPAKSKYVRNILLGSHKEGGATTMWSYILNLPLSSNAIISWKFCYLLHKVLRDGHRNAVRDSHKYCRNVKDMGALWGNLHDRYGHLVALSAKFLCLKMEFHNQHKVIPGNLEASDDTLEREAGTDRNRVLDMTQELLEYLDAGLKMADTVFRQMETNGAKPNTPAGQCRLMPMIPLIPDCSFLYHFCVRLLFKLHSCIAADVLLGHRERFRELFNSLKQFFNKARAIEFFKTYIQIPELPDAPPNFLRAAALAEYKRPVVVIQNQDRFDDDDTESQADLRDSQQYYLLNQMGMPDADQRDHNNENASLKRELDVLKPELELIKSEAQRCVTELRAQVNHLEAEVEEQRTHRQMAHAENEHLRKEVEALRHANVANVGAQIGFKEADSRAQAAEIRFTQLKEKHAELVTSHADLMKKNADTTKYLAHSKQDQEDMLRTKQRLESELENLRREKANLMHQQQNDADHLNKELLEQRAELALLRSTLASKEMEGSQAGSSLAALQAERDALLRSAQQRDVDLSSMRQQQSTGDLERDRLSRELEALRAQLQQQANREGELAHKLQEEQFCLLQCAVVEAEGIILDAMAKLDDPIHVRCICSPDYLVNRAETTLVSVDKMQQSHVIYVANRNDASGLLRAVTQFSHLAADTIVNGGATSNSAPTDQADRLTDSCRDCANNCLQFLKDLKLQASLPRADSTAIRYAIQRILALGQELRPKGQDVLKEELGNMVDKEMLATSTAIEEAVLRMDEILSQARRDTSGLKLEVNQSILGSCSDLMKAVHMLVTASTDLQKDIVEGGRGAASVPEFYAKNSRWTEGLISASKAVGWGATQLLESADRVVGDNGTYEELIACSHEIAASTAQLVAASKVKAERGNRKLSTLQQASRHVNDMAAVVVTSTKHGQQQISEQGAMDFSGMSLIKLKKEEMEAQVRVLQLESQLDQERIRLGELRKRHYDVGALQEGDLPDGDESFPPPPPPTLLDSTSFPPPPPPEPAAVPTFASTNPFAPAASQTFSLPSQPYTPCQSYLPSQAYTPSQPYPSSQLHTSSQAYIPNASQNYLKTSYSSPQPSSVTPSTSQHSPQSQSTDSKTTDSKSMEFGKLNLRKPSIFSKSGNLFKNAFKRGETGSGTGES